MRLLKLELNAFRGATRPLALQFDPAKRVTLIFGENGTGKTTVADALICLCTADHGSLDDKSGTDKNHLVAAGCPPADLSLRLHTDQGVFAAAYSSKKIVKNPATVPLALRHLRRSSVVALATAAPAQRYEQLAEYFDLPGIVRSETALRDLARSIRAEAEKNARALAAVENILEATWKNEGSPHDTWQEWAATELRKDLSAEQAKLSALRAALTAWDRATLALEKLNDTQSQGRAAAQNRQQQEQLLAEQQAAAAQDSALLPLLEEARRCLAASHHRDSGTCPLCSQPADHARLLSDLSTRLDGMNALRQATAAATAARTEHERLQTLWQADLDTLLADLTRFVAAAARLDNTPAFAERLLALQNPELAPRSRAEAFGEARPALAPLMLGKTIQADAISKTLDQHGLIRENWGAIQDCRAAAEHSAALQNATDQALKIVETARKTYIEAELAAISDEIDDLYQRLHPDEHIGGVRLSLKEKGKNSLELSARFHGLAEVTPQSLYSESHLDTLALCIFFALAKRYGAAHTVLLLDDVLSTCDEPHLERFLQLLHDESRHFAHIIVTTHYRPWLGLYRQRPALQAEMHLIELGTWTPERGIWQQ